MQTIKMYACILTKFHQGEQSGELMSRAGTCKLLKAGWPLGWEPEDVNKNIQLCCSWLWPTCLSAAV